MATLAELLTQLRIDIDDVEAPQLWSDAELTSYINRAFDEVCFRSRGILDSNLELRLRPGIESYEVDCRILSIHRMKSDNGIVEQTSTEALEACNAKWEIEQAERPSKYLLDEDSDLVRLYPIPSIAQTLRLTVWRLPKTLEHSQDKPEINKAHHYNALHWAKHLAYSKHDADAFDKDAADNCAAMFAELFGHRRSAEVTNILRRHRNLKVKTHFR